MLNLFTHLEHMCKLFKKNIYCNSCSKLIDYLLKLTKIFYSRGPVLCLALSTSGDQCFSGGMDNTIRCWNVPSSLSDPYDSFGMKQKFCNFVCNLIFIAKFLYVLCILNNFTKLLKIFMTLHAYIFLDLEPF